MRLVVALLAVLTMLAGPVAAAGLSAGCDQARAATPSSQPQAMAPCPMHEMAANAPSASPESRQPVKSHGFSCAQICAMAGAVVVQPEGSILAVNAEAGAVDYPIAADGSPPRRAPPGLEHPPKAA